MGGLPITCDRQPVGGETETTPPSVSSSVMLKTAPDMLVTTQFDHLSMMAWCRCGLTQPHGGLSCPRVVLRLSPKCSSNVPAVPATPTALNRAFPFLQVAKSRS